MDAEKIIQELNRKFQAPLPEFYKRRIIVWVDEDQEFIDKLDEITVSGAKVVALTGRNNFYVKKLLAVDDPTSNYLVYRPFAYESDEDNWLLDVELYGEEFRADLISMWMEEMGIQPTPELRRCVKQYRRFFDDPSYRMLIKNQNASYAKSAQLQLAILSALANAKEAKPGAIIKAVLQAGLENGSNPVYQNFVSFGIDGTFWRMIAKGTGYENESHDLSQLATHLLMTAATRTLHQEFLSGLQMFISSAHQSYCYDFVSDWIHDVDAMDIYSIAEYIEAELNLPQRFMKLSVQDLVDTEIFPCINEVILVKLMAEIGDNIIDVDTITRAVEKRRTCVWYDEVKDFYEGILQVAKMQTFYKEHAAGFHTVEPEKVWKEYTSEYYLMDTYYRLFHRCYSASKRRYHEELTGRFHAVMDKVEGLYVNWFLGQLGNNWSDACADDFREYGRVLEVPQQTEFYVEKVAPVDYKQFVIVSDALRYEVAVTLAERLRRETQAKVNLGSMQALFPTITKCGMAALLPHRKLTAEIKNGEVAILADGESTDSYNREKVLKSANSRSVILKYGELIEMKGPDRTALIRDKDVVYIYHDTIDAAGHIETTVFEACDTAVEELRNMVRIICNEWKGVHILITADHGFLYTHKPLHDEDKIGNGAERGQLIELGRRYAIMQKGAQPEYLLPVQFFDVKAPFDAFTPRESIRIKLSGAGQNFVHGGISLQELVVPVIDYHYLRNQSAEYKKNQSKYDTKPVEISLLSVGRKISNMIFSLNFYQKDAVGGNREAATYQLYFTDSNGKTISDVQRIIADKASDNGQERTFRCGFNLKSMKYNNTDTYYLVIADENGMQVQREEFQIDIAFAVDEFDFFV